MTWKIIFSIVTVGVYQKHLLEISWENIKRFSKNEKHTPKWAQKYQKMALSRDENDVNISVVTIMVSSDARLRMTHLRIW